MSAPGSSDQLQAALGALLQMFADQVGAPSPQQALALDGRFQPVLQVEPASVSAGAPITVRAALADQQGRLHQTFIRVTAVHESSQTARTIEVADDGRPPDAVAGDGIYSGSVALDAPGTHMIAAFGVEPGNQRTYPAYLAPSQMVEVRDASMGIGQQSTIQTRISAAGRLEAASVEVPFSLSEAATVDVVALVRSASGAEIPLQAQAHLTPPADTVSIPITPAHALYLGAGPYELRHLYIDHRRTDGTTTTYERQPGFTTPAFGVSSIRR
jgi:hypothetical protein